ncbi:putative gustatory receptor 28b [Topomyia yanbarensis]|uniref:putative gustatory receptor 28b n=1 Tax=Topomyia yanbarensis TaxID=2498891 RepID=UPI00273CD8E6|nr:putative gustatory receptor 28b [Topomyia yanbarensis]
MKWFFVGSFLEAARPIYFVTRAFSLSTVTINFQDQSVEQTPTDQLVLIRGILMCCSTLYFSFRVYRVQMQQLSDSMLLTYGLYGSMIVSVCSLLTTIISNYGNGLEVFRGATILNKVDQQTTSERDLQKLTDTESCCKMVRKFATIHAQLSDTIEVFNRCFSAQAMVGLAAAFGFTVFSIFGVIHSYATSANETTLRLAWSNMTYDGFYIALIVQLVVFSSLVFVECKHTSVMIHKALCYGTYDRKVRKELKIFSQQLWHHAPKVSCSLFHFDWTLFYTMASSLTTYLVILMQFDLTNFDYAGLTDKKNLAPQ